MTMDSTAYPQRRSAQKPAAAYRGLPFAARMVLTALERIRFGSMTLALPDGRRFEFRGAEPGPSAFLQVHDNAMFTRLAMGGSLGFAEAYLDGTWNVIDATRLSDRRSLVRIATGRDAADCAFLSYHGGYVGLSAMRVDAVAVPDAGGAGVAADAAGGAGATAAGDAGPATADAATASAAEPDATASAPADDYTQLVQLA